MYRQQFYSPLTDQDQPQTYQIAVCHPHQVHKRREAHKSGIRMEDSESRKTHYHKDTRSKEHLGEVLHQQIRLMEQPVDRHRAEHDNQAVNQKDTPVGQGVFGKIPV